MSSARTKPKRRGFSQPWKQIARLSPKLKRTKLTKPEISSSSSRRLRLRWKWENVEGKKSRERFKLFTQTVRLSNLGLRRAICFHLGLRKTSPFWICLPRRTDIWPNEKPRYPNSDGIEIQPDKFLPTWIVIFTNFRSQVLKPLVHLSFYFIQTQP